MPDIENTLSLSIQYKAVELLSAKLSMPEAPPVADQKYNFTINLEHKFIKDQKIIFVLVNIIINLEGSEQSSGEVLISNAFFIENYEEVVIEENGEPEGIQVAAADIFNSVSISTARGVLSQQFRGTWLHTAVLPVINPRDLTVVGK